MKTSRIVCSFFVAAFAVFMTANAIAQDVNVTGKWELVGKEGEWKKSRAIVAMDGFLWSVESDGSLVKADPNTGARTRVGDKGLFEKVMLMEGMDHMLYTVEKIDKGTLYKTDPKTGDWEKLSDGGSWSKTVDMVALNGFLYSIEPDGTLWKTDKNGNDTQLGDKGDFKGATHLTEMGGKLYTIEEGTLYQTDPNTLKWQQIGKEGDFANITAIEGTKSIIFMIDNSGKLYKVDATGKKTLLGDDYGETTILTTLNGKLWTVEAGSLYRTQ